MSNGAANVTVAGVETAGFTAFDDDIEALRAAGVRIFGPDASVAQDLEPEYVAIDADSTTAWVPLQENNAFAVVDLASATVTDILPLGFKDHSLPGDGFDASNRDGKINIQNWPVKGMYMPDAIEPTSSPVAPTSSVPTKATPVTTSAIPRKPESRI